MEITKRLKEWMHGVWEYWMVHISTSVSLYLLFCLDVLGGSCLIVNCKLILKHN